MGHIVTWDMLRGSSALHAKLFVAHATSKRHAFLFLNAEIGFCNLKIEAPLNEPKNCLQFCMF
jgi:hypothetical protein